MIVKYIVSDNKLNDKFNYIEVLLLNSILLENEKTLLNNCNIKYQYLEDNSIRIILDDFYAYYVETSNKKNGVYLEKTKKYYEYLKNIPHINEIEKKKNLIISKNGIKIEVIVD